MVSDKSELVALRHWVHAHPEVSWEEQETAEHILEFLKKYSPDDILRLAGHGIAAIYNGREEGKTVLIRAELDGLPIHEVNDELPYKSEVEGQGHKCGHDGHMTMVAGLAPWLDQNRPEKGRVVLLFQPAEETGEGAKKVFEDENFKKIIPDYAFAIHNIPGYPMHTIMCKEGIFSAAVISIIIKLEGKTSHAGEPEKGINPADAIAEIIQLSRQLPNQNSGKEDYTLITPVHIRMGEKAYGTSAGEGELHFTLRAWGNKKLQALSDKFEEEIKAIAQNKNLKVEIDWTEEFKANKNDESAVDMIREATKENDLKYHQMASPFRWGEDFGLISSNVRGAMFGLGAGEKTPALHNPDYDFPDELITTGVKMYQSLIDKVLNQ